MLAVDLTAEEVLTLPDFAGATLWFLRINQTLTTDLFFPSLLYQRAAIRVYGYFPLNGCPAQSAVPLNFVSKIKELFTYFCKPCYCIYWVFLCAEEPCSSHKDPHVCAAKALAGWQAAWVRKQWQAEGNCAAFFLNWVRLLGLKQTLLECISRYLLSDPVECLGYFCFFF